MPAEDRALQEKVGSCCHDRDEDERNRQPGDPSVCEPGDRRRDRADAAVCHREDRALENAEHAKGEDERRDLQPVDQLAVQGADRRRAGDDCNDREGRHARLRAHPCAADHGDQTDKLADRQVDQAAGNDEGLPERQDRKRSRLVEHIEEIAGRAEGRNRRDADQQQGRKSEVDFGAAGNARGGASQAWHCNPLV